MVSKNSFGKDEVKIGNRYLFPDKVDELEEKRSKKINPGKERFKVKYRSRRRWSLDWQ